MAGPNLPYADPERDDSVRLPWDDYEPSGDDEAAWLAHRAAVAAALIEFDGCPPPDLEVVGPQPR